MLHISDVIVKAFFVQLTACTHILGVSLHELYFHSHSDNPPIHSTTGSRSGDLAGHQASRSQKPDNVPTQPESGVVSPSLQAVHTQVEGCKPTPNAFVWLFFGWYRHRWSGGPFHPWCCNRLHIPDGPHVCLGTELPQALEVHFRGVSENISWAGREQELVFQSIQFECQFKWLMFSWRPALRTSSKNIVLKVSRV